MAHCVIQTVRVLFCGDLTVDLHDQETRAARRPLFCVKSDLLAARFSYVACRKPQARFASSPCAMGRSSRPWMKRSAPRTPSAVSPIPSTVPSKIERMAISMIFLSNIIWLARHRREPPSYKVVKPRARVRQEDHAVKGEFPDGPFDGRAKKPPPHFAVRNQTTPAGQQNGAAAFLRARSASKRRPLNKA